MLEAILRVVHIFVGVFLVGYYFTMLPFVLPALVKLGPDMPGRVANLMRPVLEPVMWVATFLIVGTGVAWALTLSGGISQLFSSGWGWAMIIGLVLTIAWAIMGNIVMDGAIRRADRLGRSIQGRAPTPEEARQLGRLAQRTIPTIFGVLSVLIFLIFIDMLIARYL